MEQLLAHPDERRRLADDPALLPARGRGDAAVGVADQEHEPHRHPRRRVRRPAVARRRQGAAAVRVGELRRGALRRAGALRRRADAQRPPGVRLRRALLPRRQPRPPRVARYVRAGAAAACPTSSWRPTNPCPGPSPASPRCPSATRQRRAPGVPEAPDRANPSRAPAPRLRTGGSPARGFTERRLELTGWRVPLHRRSFCVACSYSASPPKIVRKKRKMLRTSRKIDAASWGALLMSSLRRRRWKSKIVKPAKITSPRTA